jgi:heat shock protein dnaJ domain protein
MQIFYWVVAIIIASIIGKGSNNRVSVLSFILRVIFIVFVLSIIVALSPFLIFLIILFFLFRGKIINVNRTSYYTNEDFERFRNQYNQYNQNRGYNDSFSQYNFDSEVEKACSILGVNKEDSFEIKKKRRNELLKKWHPDFYTDEEEKKKATEVINKINNAWEIIEKYHGVK